MNPTIFILLVPLLVMPADPFADLRGLSDGPPFVDAVIYADVTAVAEDRPNSAVVTLEVKYTLTGPYDAARYPVLKSSIRLQSLVGAMRFSSIKTPPKVNEHVVALVRCSPSDPAWHSRMHWSMTSKFADFMPDGSAMVVVQGLDDPRVVDLMARLRKLRAAKPLDPWEAARGAMAVELANRQTAAGDPVTRPSPMFDFLYPRPKPTKDDAK
jgi:hypothetical protein